MLSWLDPRQMKSFFPFNLSVKKGETKSSLIPKQLGLAFKTVRIYVECRIRNIANLDCTLQELDPLSVPFASCDG